MPAPWKGRGRGWGGGPWYQGRWGPPGGSWGWGRGPGWWTTYPPANMDTYMAKATELLSSVTKGQPASYPGGLRIPLIRDGTIVGELWEDVNVAELNVGWIRACRWGILADLVYQGRVVGFLYVEGYPGAWGPGFRWWGPFRGLARWFRGWW